MKHASVDVSVDNRFGPQPAKLDAHSTHCSVPDSPDVKIVHVVLHIL